MITSAIILSKVTVTLRFRPRCVLCHWLVLFARCFLHIWKTDWYRISNWTAPKTKNNWDFNFPNGSIFIYKIWDWELRKRYLKKLQDLPEKFQEKFFQEFPNGPLIFCLLWPTGFYNVNTGNERVSSTGKSRQMILFYLYLYLYFFLIMFSSYKKPIYNCKQQFSILNHTIPLLLKKWF